MSLMDAFNIGKQMKGKGAANIMQEGVMEDFQTKNKYDQLLNIERAKSQMMSPKDIAMANYYDKSAEAISGGGMGTVGTDIEGIAAQSGMAPEDYVLTPTVNRFKGQTRVTNTPQLKQPMPESGALLIRSGRQSALGLANNMNKVTPNVERRMGSPWLGHISAMKGALGDTILNLQTAFGDKDAPEFSSFKSQSDILFQNFRKFITGVQAAYPEIQMLTPDYPQTTDQPEIYMKKATDLIHMADRIEQQVLDMESQRGYRTGELRGGSLSKNPLINSVYNKNGVPRSDTANDASQTSPTGDKRAEYNKLRASGLSAQEARARLGV